MGRVRAKGKKLAATNQDDIGSSEEVKVIARKRRGRPQKSLKDDIDEDEAPKIEDGDSEDTTGEPIKEAGNKTGTQNGKKQKGNVEVKEKVDLAKEEIGNGTKSSSEESKKLNNFRHNRSRRKNKPCRAAEAVVECN